MVFELLKLFYVYDVLELYIDVCIMEIYYIKYYVGYIFKLNVVIEGIDLEKKSIKEIFVYVLKYSVGVCNNGGGFYNYKLFWEVMFLDGGGELFECMNIYKVIMCDFGFFEKFKDEFVNVVVIQFGFGWVWLCVDKNDKLFVIFILNQDNLFMDVVDVDGMFIFGLDVWEYVYYLNYQNCCLDYIEVFFNVIDWGKVSENYNDVNEGVLFF